jgi:hypothetical protein
VKPFRRSAVPQSDQEPKPLPTPREGKALIAELAQAREASDYEQFTQVPNGEERPNVDRPSANKLLVGPRCWLAAYDRGGACWIMYRHKEQGYLVETTSPQDAALVRFVAEVGGLMRRMPRDEFPRLFEPTQHIQTVRHSNR